MHAHTAPPALCAAQQLQRTARRCWQLLLQHPPLASSLEPELLARCTRADANRRLSRSFVRWNTAARRRNDATLRWAASGLSERLFRADPAGELLSRALCIAEPLLSASREPCDIGHLFALHRAFADYRGERSRLVARYAHVVEQLVAASQVQPQDFEDTLHDGIVRLAAAPAAYRADRSDSFEAFVREWLAQQLGLQEAGLISFATTGRGVTLELGPPLECPVATTTDSEAVDSRGSFDMRRPQPRCSIVH